MSASSGTDWQAVPVVRALAIPGFRPVLAMSAVLFGLALSLVFLGTLAALEMPILSDFEEYYRAAQRLLEGESLYHAAHLLAPVEAACVDCYRYPPVLAQAAIPLAVLPLPVAKAIWFGLTTAAALASTWLATGIGGAPRSLERVLWCAAATLLFFPVISGNAAGNVSSLIALSATLVALGGVASGVAAALAALLKVVPGVFAPAAFVEGRRSRRALLVTLLAVAGVSFLLSPGAWLDYPAMFFNMTAGMTDYERNLALANGALQAGLPDLLVGATRIATLAVGLGGLGLSVWAARRPGGMPVAALGASVALLLLQPTVWPHYFAVLLPFAAMAWPPARSGTRVSLFLASAVLAVAVLFGHYALVYAGGAALVAVAGWALWPDRGASPR